ncbi:MAG TPA: TonB-dependent receptor [Candidatus Limnocylindria bacterium]|jgi:iron complex outermembrane receptor protein|nr:TonB-dependent receptor [Candidatus Limnocylindria bacterium]
MIPTVIAAVLVAAAASSPHPSPTPVPSIGTVTVVSGSAQSLHRAPQAASVLNAQALRTSTAPTLDAALRALPGFDRGRSDSSFTNYGQERLSFSGAGQDRGSLFVDGIPAQDGFGGQVDWSLYPALGLSRAEVLRGPGSALYGSGAIGGVLSLLTMPPSLEPNGAYTASYGGIDRGSGSFVATEPLGESWSSAFTLSTQKLGFDDLPPSQASYNETTAYSTSDVAHARVRHTTQRSTLDLDALAGTDAQNNGRPNYGMTRNVNQAAATYTVGTTATLALTAFARDAQVYNTSDRYPTNPGTLLYDQYVPSSDAGVRLRWDRPAGDGAWTLLGERRFVTGSSNQLNYSATGALLSNPIVAGTQDSNGFAFQRTWEGRFGGIVGARYDEIATDALGLKHAGAISPRVDVRYDTSPALSLRASYGTGLRAPYLNELIRSYRIGTAQYNSNPNLDPERSRSGQFGIDVGTSASHLAVDYTGTVVHDALGFSTSPLSTTAAPIFVRSNFGETATNAYTLDYRRGGPCADVRVFGVAQHDRVVQGSPAQIGKRLAYIPDEAAAVDVERTVRNVTGALELSYSGPTFADDQQQQPIGTAFLVGGRLDVHGPGGSTISLAVDNLADRVYLTSIDRLGPPSSVTLRLSAPVGAGARPAAAPAAVCPAS